MPGYVLYTWGVLPFETYPLNINEAQHVTGTDWARKEIAGAAIYREWVGENDEELHLRGRVFPHYFAHHARRTVQNRTRFGDIGAAKPQQFGGRLVSSTDMPFVNPTSGGLGHLDVMDNMRRLGQAHVLTRGDGWHMGWYVVEKLVRSHTNIWLDGIGQQIEFEVTFQRVPVIDDAEAYFPAFWGAISP